MIGVLVPLLVSSPAAASSTGLARATSCPTEVYTGATIGNCTTSTTGATSVTIHLYFATAPGYSNGRFTWKICGYPSSAVGDTIRLYIGGATETGWTTTVAADGCATFSVPWCPTHTGTYTVAAIDVTHPNIPEATGTVTVNTIGSACAASGTNGGHLAFTGGNFLRILVAAILAILVGYILVRINRQRHRAR